ncbi:MAG: hypothetical protein SFV54_12170 [Bryobacteraceae bacterium]|nr:hypothetical protein [Bryobacteraceae bacterium]
MLIRAAYVSNDRDQMVVASGEQMLNSDYAHLMLPLPSLDGPPFRTAIGFAHPEQTRIPWRHGTRGHGDADALRYVATSALDTAAIWHADIIQRRLVFFLTGQASATNLWRIVRVEVDPAKRYLFTLSPVELASGLPSADFSAIGNTASRSEAEQHWGELQDHLLHHRYYALITAAKNVAEAVAAAYVSNTIGWPKRTFDYLLKEIAAAIERRDDTLSRFRRLITTSCISSGFCTPGRTLKER